MSAVVLLWIVIAILAFVITLGVFAFFMLGYRIVITSKEVDIPLPKSAAAKKDVANKSSKSDNKNMVVRFDPSTSSKFGYKGIHISIAPESSKSTEITAVSSAAISPPKKEKTEFERKLERWHQKHLAEKALNPDAKKKKRIFPPWDEVEMRRHGLVTRHCDRVCGPNYPSDPSSIEVSVYNPYSSGGSLGSIQCSVPPDSSSTYSSQFSRPLATSTPKSAATASSKIYSLGSDFVAPRYSGNANAAASSSSSQSRPSSAYAFDQGAKEAFMPQSSSIHTGVTAQHHPEHQVPQNIGTGHAASQSRHSSVYMFEQGAKDDAAVTAKQFPQSSAALLNPSVPHQAAAPNGLQPQQQQPEKPVPAQADPSQISLPSQASVYAEPNLHNPPFAYQKTKL